MDMYHKVAIWLLYRCCVNDCYSFKGVVPFFFFFLIDPFENLRAMDTFHRRIKYVQIYTVFHNISESS